MQESEENRKPIERIRTLASFDMITSPSPSISATPSSNCSEAHWYKCYILKFILYISIAASTNYCVCPTPIPSPGTTIINQGYIKDDPAWSNTERCSFRHGITILYGDGRTETSVCGTWPSDTQVLQSPVVGKVPALQRFRKVGCSKTCFYSTISNVLFHDVVLHWAHMVVSLLQVGHAQAMDVEWWQNWFHHHWREICTMDGGTQEWQIHHRYSSAKKYTVIYTSCIYIVRDRDGVAYEQIPHSG